jgi:hypothetical protein
MGIALWAEFAQHQPSILCRRRSQGLIVAKLPLGKLHQVVERTAQLVVVLPLNDQVL